jgi:hypothetical protein
MDCFVRDLFLKWQEDQLFIPALEVKQFKFLKLDETLSYLFETIRRTNGNCFLYEALMSIFFNFNRILVQSSLFVCAIRKSSSLLSIYVLIKLLVAPTVFFTLHWHLEFSLTFNLRFDQAFSSTYYAFHAILAFGV